jgi:hypothetical protein
MAKPKRKKGLPKTSQEWAALTPDEVMRKVFGKRGQETLKQEAEKAPKQRKDQRLPA